MKIKYNICWIIFSVSLLCVTSVTSTGQLGEAPQTAVLLYSDSHFQYFKLPGDFRVKSSVETCRSAGLTGVCPGDEECHHTDTSSCVVTGLSGECGQSM